MGVYFQQGGHSGMLDVAAYLEGQGLTPYKVKDGNVMFTDESGREGMFSVADWAMQNGAQIQKIDGFNTPVTALDVPPNGMNSLDQSVWYMGGGNLDALKELFPQAQELSDGRVVVLDNDGLWKTMWSDTWTGPEPLPTHQDLVDMGQAVDSRVGLRAAGMLFLCGLAGVDPRIGSDGEIEIQDLEKTLRVIATNAPEENKFLLGKLVNQTTGLDEWKFAASLSEVSELGEALRQCKRLTTMQIRMRQGQLAELVVKAMHKMAMMDFGAAMGALEKLPETKTLVVNLKEVTDEFVQMMDSMQVIAEIRKITGMVEWEELDKVEVDKSKLPPVPEFVDKLQQLLRVAMPISATPALGMAKGKRGFKAIMLLMLLSDDCLYALADVPDSQAKQKMHMVLKTLQAKLESKLAFFYHPMGDKTGQKLNPFMEAKMQYGDKREVVYKIIQLPKEEWNGMILDNMRKEPNLEAFYSTTPQMFAELVKSLVALDVAYDMQPWIDGAYQKRINDPLAMMTENTGAPPPEYGYLADNSPRAAYNILSTLSKTAAMLVSMGEGERRAILRSPMLLANLMKTVQVAAVRREVGTVETLNRMGFGPDMDPYKSADPHRIWDDPVQVKQEQEAAMMELVSQMQQQYLAEKQAQDQQNVAAQAQAMQAPQPAQGA